MLHTKKILSSCVLATAIFSTNVSAEVDFKLGFQTVSGDYSESSAKKSIASSGPILNITFLDDVTFTHTYTDTKIKFDDPANNIAQTSQFSSLGYNTYSDEYGKINFRIDHQSINNDDTTGKTDNVSINSVQVSNLPFDDSYYAELGYSSSSYPGDSLDIKQVNLSYGTGITDADWLSVKLFRITSSDATKTHNQASFNAVEGKYKYFLGENFAKVSNLELTILTGERVFAVDGAAGSAYNMGDMQTGSIGLTSEWKFGENMNLLASISREDYKTSADVEYTGDYKYLNFNYQF